MFKALKDIFDVSGGYVPTDVGNINSVGDGIVDVALIGGHPAAHPLTAVGSVPSEGEELIAVIVYGNPRAIEPYTEDRVRLIPRRLLKEI